MSTTRSWHRAGQNVTMKDNRAWNALEGTARGDEPQYGSVYSIREVCCVRTQIFFRLQEVRAGSLFDASSFVPVYPAIVAQLQRIEAPQPERVAEDA